MKKVVKVISFMMALIFVLSGCSSNDSKNEDIPEYVYSAKLMETPEDIQDIHQINYRDGKLYIYCSMMDEEDVYKSAICSMNPDGTDFTTIYVTEEYEDESFYINSFAAGSDGCIWISGESGSYNEETGEYINSNYIKKIDAQGNEIKNIKLLVNGENESSTSTENTSSSDTHSELMLAASVDYFYIDKLIADAEDNLYIVSNSLIYVFDSEGNSLFNVGDESGNSWIRAVQQSNDGSVYASMRSSEGFELRKINVETKKFDESVELPESLVDADGMYSGPDYSMYMNDGSNLMGINFENGTSTEPVEIFNWVDSDIDSNNIQDVLCIGNDTYIVSCWDSNWNTELNMITKQKYEDSEKEIITLGTLNYGSIKSSVVKFNKTNDKYRIKLKEYYTDDLQTAINAVNTDIATGNAPDIIELNALSVDNYVSKGLLEDLYPYFENDDEISKDDYVQSVLKALEIDGKLYSITPSFSIVSVLAKASVVGKDRHGWTLDELYETLDAQPDGTIAFANATKTDMLSALCMMNINNFIDYSTGKCNFESDEFIDILEFAKQFSTDIDYSSENYESELSQIYSGKAMLYPTEIYQIEDFQFIKGVLGEDVTFIGYPSENSSGTYVRTSEVLGISSKSKHKDGAWEFIKTLLTDEHQTDRNSTWSFPIKNSALDEIFEEAMTPNTYIDENGNEVESPKMGIGMDDFMVDIMAATQEEVDELRSIIDSIDSVYNRYNTSVLDLIIEDAGAFFEGQKTAKDTASIIQNRVQTYINESR